MTPHPPKPADPRLRELVLTILWGYREHVPGSLFLQKLAFLCIFEIPELRDLKGLAGYRARQFGPFSVAVRIALQELETQGLVVVATVRSDRFNKDLIGLTPKGLETAREIAGGMNVGLLAEIERKCRGAKQLGYAGILRYVYSHYENYAEESEIRDEVFESFGRYSH